MLSLFIKDFTKSEKDIILRLNELLKKIDKEPTYTLDESVSHAKYFRKSKNVLHRFIYSI